MKWGRKPEVLLEDWEPCGKRLYGMFKRHKVIPDSTYAHTSELIQFDPTAGYAESENTMYTLGYRHHGHGDFHTCPRKQSRIQQSKRPKLKINRPLWD